MINDAGSLPRTFEARFPWGVLLISDSESNEPIPAWESTDATVANAKTALVVRVCHADEGVVSVNVFAQRPAIQSAHVFDGQIFSPTGILRFSDAAGSQTFDVRVTPGFVGMQIYVNDLLEATEVNIILRE